MPARPRKPCAYAGCQRLTQRRYCDEHASTTQRKTAEKGYGSRWQRVSRAYRMRNPLCVWCQRNGRVEPARVVDHITPHRNNYELFWNEDNWQSLCIRCHNKKSRKEQIRSD